VRAHMVLLIDHAVANPGKLPVEIRNQLGHRRP
jgi:hypothetical protein